VIGYEQCLGRNPFTWCCSSIVSANVYNGNKAIA
jgi:hypothetical protein